MPLSQDIITFARVAVLYTLKLFQLQAMLLLLVSVLMYIFYTNVTALWVLYVSTGALIAPLVGSGLGMVKRYMKMNSVVHSIPQIGAAIGDLIIMFAAGYSYDNFGPYTIWSYFLAIGVIVFSVATVMQGIGHYHGDRFDKK